MIPFMVLLAATCGRGGPGPTAPSIPAGIQSVAPPPKTVEYTRVNVAGDVALPENRIREDWVGPALSDDLLTWDVTSTDITAGGRGQRLETVRHFVGKDGYGYLGTVDEAGALTAWEPRQVLLPPDPKVGDTWTAEHTKASSVSKRSCEILDSDYCPGGIVVVCDSRKDGGVIILRDHFCQGVGWGGFEALVQTGNSPSVRMWSEELIRDGAPVPEPAGDAP